ncbi:GNAT family N-acyltransferase [Loktanella sp. SALINAS62]|uniref:GNAT family N-acetyltransferase n=1 Tax=Loktanella sp. SALINAS62 TaxID=2706124 RepID=UPI001B8CA049|nr:GNAT family N-acyltransferase [Loktanella sp. SALINAS62]MBS1302780.1 GNAT family N-acetyltransferase [Loktanella sp. SALINAS62]
MLAIAPGFTARFARSDSDLRSVQSLRYDVFVKEMGAGGPSVDHATGRESDVFDIFASHLMLEHDAHGQRQLAGVYRLMDRAQAQAAGGFSAAAEFDLAPLLNSGRPVIEVGRSCVRADYRGGQAMHMLWSGLASHLRRTGAEVLFGAASFAGTDSAALRAPLGLLMAQHLAPPDLRTQARGPGAVDVTPDAGADRKATLRAIPALIKAYLRLGGVVGQGACVDADFGTTDVCMILDVARMRPDLARQFGQCHDLVG